MGEIRLSASAISDFLKCNRMYWYRRFEPEEAVSTEEILIGNIVHKAIEKHWNDKDAAIDFIDFSTPALSPIGYAHAMNSVNGFFTHYSNLLEPEDKIESFFSVPYPNSKDVKLVGKFDRISKAFTVYDWKTSKNPPLSVSKDPQFMLYYYAYTQLYNSTPNLFYAGLDGSLISYRHDKKLFDIFFNDVIYKVVSEIKAGHFEPVGLFKYYTCEHCLYKIHCYKTLLGREVRR